MLLVRLFNKFQETIKYYVDTFEININPCYLENIRKECSVIDREKLGIDFNSILFNKIKRY